MQVSVTSLIFAAWSINPSPTPVSGLVHRSSLGGVDVLSQEFVQGSVARQDHWTADLGRPILGLLPQSTANDGIIETIFWRFHKLGYPKWLVYRFITENPMKMEDLEDLGVPVFPDTINCRNINCHINCHSLGCQVPRPSECFAGPSGSGRHRCPRNGP